MMMGDYGRHLKNGISAPIVNIPKKLALDVYFNISVFLIILHFVTKMLTKQLLLSPSGDREVKVVRDIPINPIQHTPVRQRLQGSCLAPVALVWPQSIVRSRTFWYPGWWWLWGWCFCSHAPLDPDIEFHQRMWEEVAWPGNTSSRSSPSWWGVQWWTVESQKNVRNQTRMKIQRRMKEYELRKNKDRHLYVQMSEYERLNSSWESRNFWERPQQEQSSCPPTKLVHYMREHRSVRSTTYFTKYVVLWGRGEF